VGSAGEGVGAGHRLLAGPLLPAAIRGVARQRRSCRARTEQYDGRGSGIPCRPVRAAFGWSRHSSTECRRPPRYSTSAACCSDEFTEGAPSNKQETAAPIGGCAMAIDYRPFVFYGGNCREAFTRYKEILGGDLALLTLADAPSA